MVEKLTKENDDFDSDTANYMLGRVEAIIFQCFKKNKSPEDGVREIGVIFQEKDPVWFEKLEHLWENEDSKQSSTSLCENCNKDYTICSCLGGFQSKLNQEEEKD